MQLLSWVTSVPGLANVAARPGIAITIKRKVQIQIHKTELFSLRILFVSAGVTLLTTINFI
jgi:hypothetical protein